jgi:hypothetical protein
MGGVSATGIRKRRGKWAYAREIAWKIACTSRNMKEQHVKIVH